MWWLLPIGASFAFDLDVQVTVEEAPPSAISVPRPDLPTVPVGRGVVRVDGRVDETAWMNTEPGPPLGPWMNGGAPPAVQSAVVRTGGGLAIGVWDVPLGLGLTLVLDPDGTGNRWWRVELGDRIQTRRCTLADAELPADARVPQPAVPCEADDGVQVAGGSGSWEVHVPMESLGRLTTSARLLLTAGVPGRRGGTWAPYGRSEAVPSVGRLLELGRRPGRLAVELAEDGDWDVVLRLRDADPLGVWEVRRFVHGREVDIERPTLTGPGATVVSMQALDAASVVVEASVSAGDGLWHSVVRQVRPVLPRAWMASVVVDDEVELGWSSPRPVTRTIRLQTRTGRVLAEREISLPRGGGRVRIPVTWKKKDLVLVWDGLMAPTRLVAP